MSAVKGKSEIYRESMGAREQRECDMDDRDDADKKSVRVRDYNSHR